MATRMVLVPEDQQALAYQQKITQLRSASSSFPFEPGRVDATHTLQQQTAQTQKDASLRSTPHPKTKHSETIRRRGVASRSRTRPTSSPTSTSFPQQTRSCHPSSFGRYSGGTGLRATTHPAATSRGSSTPTPTSPHHSTHPSSATQSTHPHTNPETTEPPHGYRRSYQRIKIRHRSTDKSAYAYPKPRRQNRIERHAPWTIK